MDAPGIPNTLARMTELRPLMIDDLSTVRYIHTAAFCAAAQGHYSQREITSFTDYLRSPRYGELLLGNPALVAWLGADMVGTAVWCPTPPPGLTARILAVYVRPLFTGEGIGRKLIERMERDAEAAGFRAIEVSATRNAIGFFEDIGYRHVRDGSWALPSGSEIGVGFMRKARGNGLEASE